MRNLKLALLLLTMVGCSTAAQAHALLEHASLAVGSTVASSPGSVTLYFTEKLEPKFSGGGGAWPRRGARRPRRRPERQCDAAWRRRPASGPLQRDVARAFGRYAQDPRKLQLPGREMRQPDTNLLLPLVRGTFVASLFSAFGALPVTRDPSNEHGGRDADAVDGGCLRLVRTSLIAALVALLGWLALEASDMSDAENAAESRGIPVLLGTSSATICSPRRWRCLPRSCS